jgi:hypothetical protein
MTLIDLLTLLGIVVAAWALLDPPSRAFAELIVDWRAPITVFAALVTMSLVGNYWSEAWGRLPRGTLRALEIASFVLPVAVGAYYATRISRRKITERHLVVLADFLNIARSAKRYDLVRDVVTRNADLLRRSGPAGVFVVLCREDVIRDCLETEQYDLIELLLHPDVRARVRQLSVAPRLAIALLEIPTSPVRRAILEHDGGDEHAEATETDERILAHSFESPTWFIRSGARYRVLIWALEEIDSGSLDAAYNGDPYFYARRQGLSGRATCRLFLVIRVYARALHAAAAAGFAHDCYATDLSDIARTILRHCRIEAEAWESHGLEWKTPYHYLLHEIVTIIEDVLRTAVDADLKAGTKVGPVFQQVAQTWSIITTALVQNDEKIPERQSMQLASRQIDWALRLKSVPFDVLHHAPNRDTSPHALELMREFVEHNCYTTRAPREVAMRLFDQLDFGKGWVRRDVLDQLISETASSRK